MSLAKQIVGEPVTRTVSKPSAMESQPIHPMDLIDSLAAQEFGPTFEAGVKHDRTGVGSPAEGSSPKFGGKKGKEQRGKLATGKTTKGQVAPAPKGSDPVKYGKK